MALFAKIRFGDNYGNTSALQYDITRVKTYFARTYNHSRPEGRPRCQQIEITIVAPDFDDLNLYDWYINQGTQNCQLLYSTSAFNDSSIHQLRQITLTSAVCYGLEENYHIDSDARRTLTLSITADEVEVEDLTFQL
jgi:hypothetical protein